MTFAQTRDEVVLGGVASNKGMCQLLLSKQSDEERHEIMSFVDVSARKYVTATVSHVGKTDYKEAENYIRDFRLCTSTSAVSLLVEISAVAGRFTIEFIQHFSSPIYVNAFLSELDDNGIVYDLQDVRDMELANVRLPWAR